MDQIDDGAPKYPMLKFVVRHGSLASIGLAALVLCVAVAAAIEMESVSVALVGVALAGLAYVLSRVLVELVGLITDMLLPQ